MPAKGADLPAATAIPDVLVVGGGVVGLAVGWRCAQRGLRTVVLEAGEAGHGASWAAAGMLAPAGEAEYGEGEVVRLGLESLGAYPALAGELHALSGVDVGSRPCGPLQVALGSEDVAALRRRLDSQTRLGLAVEWVAPSALRELEPLLSPRVRGGVLAG